MSEQERSNAWVYVAIGCGGLALLSLCLVPLGAAIWLYLAEPGTAPPPIDPLPADPLPSDPPPFDPTPGPSGGPTPTPPPGASAPRHVRAEVTEVSGLDTVSVGATCEFDVERHDRPDGTFWCRAQVRCGGQLLYGGEDAGYFDCTLYERPQRHVVGEDRNTTRADSDAAMRLDTLRQELEVRDDASGTHGAFELTARVTEVR